MLLCAAVVLFSSPAAASFCGFLFPSGQQSGIQANGVPSPVNASSLYTNLLGLSMAIILAVMAVIGMAYAIGTSFGINKLVEFSKTEIYESLANVFIIVVIVGGSAVFSNMIVLGSYLAGIGVQQVAHGVQMPVITSPLDMYTALCSNYINVFVFQLLPASLHIAVVQFVVHLLASFEVQFVTSFKEGPIAFVPGFQFKPLDGLSAVSQSLSMAASVVSFMMFVHFAVILLLFTIYYLFPIFLYVGILLRSFPLTRAAGGSMLALFISFYIVFPTLLYPFSFIGLYSPVAIWPSASINVPSFNSNPSALLSQINQQGKPGTGYVVTDPYSFVSYSIEAIVGLLIDMLGFVIAFLVSYDLLEALGGVLGAPSIRAGPMFGKVV